MRHQCSDLRAIATPFQSTHPLRGATKERKAPRASTGFQSTHPLRGATSCTTYCMLNDWPFQSTHPLRGATSSGAPKARPWKFQSTHPLRGATQNKHQQFAVQEISIHAPLAGCDYSSHHSRQDHRNFNPRTPCGVRLEHFDFISVLDDFNPRTPCGVRRTSRFRSTARLAFQSTHPLRGATVRTSFILLFPVISIHAPLAGCD